MILFFFCLSCVAWLSRQQRYYDAMSQKRGGYWAVRQAMIRELMGADELLMGTSASRRF